jgi:hypothetical protein
MELTMVSMYGRDCDRTTSLTYHLHLRRSLSRRLEEFCHGVDTSSQLGRTSEGGKYPRSLTSKLNVEC